MIAWARAAGIVFKQQNIYWVLDDKAVVHAGEVPYAANGKHFGESFNRPTISILII